MMIPRNQQFDKFHFVEVNRLNIELIHTAPGIDIIQVDTMDKLCIYIYIP